MNIPFFIRAYTGLLGVAGMAAMLGLIYAADPAPWWGVLLAAAPMGIHFGLRKTPAGTGRKRWLMPQQVITVGGLGMTINPEVVGQSSILASGLAAALVVMLYVYLFKVWRHGVEQDKTEND